MQPLESPWIFKELLKQLLLWPINIRVKSKAWNYPEKTADISRRHYCPMPRHHMTTVKIPYWSRVTTQIWVVLNLALKVLSRPWLRLVTWFPKARSQKWGRGRRVNNCHSEKRYSVGAREEFAASFIISWWRVV